MYWKYYRVIAQVKITVNYKYFKDFDHKCFNVNTVIFKQAFKYIFISIKALIVVCDQTIVGNESLFLNA